MNHPFFLYPLRSTHFYTQPKHPAAFATSGPRHLSVITVELLKTFKTLTIIPLQTGQASFELNTRVNGAHDGKVKHLTFLELKTNLGIVTCGREGKAKLWMLSEDLNDKNRVKKWDPVRTFSHVGRIPRCSDSSRDRSIIAIGFDAQITLWSSETLALISTLSTTTNKTEFYTSLAFGPGHNLLAANTTSVHVWNLLTNQLTHKMTLEVPKVIKSPKTIQITSNTGIFVVDESMKLKCLTKNISCQAGLTCSDSRCFVVEKTATENRY